MKRKIAIIAGGDSSEYDVSINSANNVFDSMDRDRYDVWMVIIQGDNWWVADGGKKRADINRHDFSFEQNGNKVVFDYAYIIIHGTPGENGILQGYFDMLRIPYSTCDVASSALTFNKYFCNGYLKNHGIKIASSRKLLKNEPYSTGELVAALGLPLFVKPNAGGSSFGITKVKREEELQAAIEKAWSEDDEALVECFIDGKEFTCGLVKLRGKILIFPVTEVIPKNEFFDFEAKYVASKAEEITPARLPQHLFNECQELSSRIYDLCSCKGIIRVDYILKDDEFYFLEVNTTPGMTATSFIPQQVRAMGMKLQEMLSLIIEESFS